jgi:HD-GYP domain-containing protein (c-di-GMP phosphodiesterase class II)
MGLINSSTVDAMLGIHESDTMESASELFIDVLGKTDDSTLRAAVYLYSRSNRKLSPLASCHFKRSLESQGFHVSRQEIRNALRVAEVCSDRFVDGQEILDIHVWTGKINEEYEYVVHWETIGGIEFARRSDWVPETFFLIQPKLQLLTLLAGIDNWVIHTARTINAAIEAKDTYTSGHSERVSRYSLALATEMGLDSSQRQLLFLSALCHDVGKIGVPDAILKKPGILSSEEFDEMKAHPEIGANIIQHTPNAHQIMDGVKYHHEKWDGTGYPCGFIGAQTPLFGRIVAIADAFDAMTSGRSYSGYLDQAEAISQLLGKSDLFDPELLAGFESAFINGNLTMRTGTLIGQSGQSTQLYDATASK